MSQAKNISAQPTQIENTEQQRHPVLSTYEIRTQADGGGFN